MVDFGANIVLLNMKAEKLFMSDVMLFLDVI